jgi:glycosyltransferase involved in cell wall biosynthesis
VSAARVSVIVPVFNGERFLVEAIESVLAQSAPALEVIVVDDGSSDASATIAGSFGGIVRCIRQENSGPASARNRGVESARGTHLAFLDADDVWMPEKLRLQVARLTANAGLDGVFGLIDHFYEPEVRERLQVRAPPAAPGLVPGTLMIKREAFLDAGPFWEGAHTGEFIDWYGRATDRGLQFETIPHVVLNRRIHSDNTSRLAANRAAYLQVIRASLERRRQAGPVGRRPEPPASPGPVTAQDLL